MIFFQYPWQKRIIALVFCILIIPWVTYGLTKEEQEAIWRTELEQTEKDIAKWQEILNNTKKGTASLQKEADILNAKIKEAQAFIKKRNIAIAQLGQDIAEKNTRIDQLEYRISQGHDSLAQLLRKTNEIDSYSLPEVILGTKNISDFFSDLDTFQSINRDLKALFEEIRATKIGRASCRERV